MPARKPTNLKLLQGTAQASRLNKNEPQPAAAVVAPEPPASLDEIGAREWRRVAPILVGVRVLTDLDLGTLERLCAMYSRAVRADRALLELGETYETQSRDGSVMYRVRPEVQVSSDSWKHYAASATALGMTPRDRAGVSALPAPDTKRDKNFA